jgi:hypothetical protein
MTLLHHLLHHLPPQLFWAFAVAFVVVPAAGLLWAAVRVERSRHPAGAVRRASRAIQGGSSGTISDPCRFATSHSH